MNIPNLPTDSLYKFISIFGLVLIVFGQYVIISQTTDLNQEKDLYNSEIKILNYDIELSKERSENFISQIQLKCAQSKCSCTVITRTDNSIEIKADAKNCDVNQDLVNEIAKVQESIGNENQKVERKRREIEAKEAIIGRKDDLLQARTSFATFMSTAGLLFSILGFWFWYKNVQRHQDIILKDQADKIIADKNSKASGQNTDEKVVD